MRYTHSLKPHSCDLHDKGPVWELQLQKVEQELAQANQENRSELRAQQRKLQTDINRYQRHLKQYEVCRADVKRDEEKLCYGDRKCVVYRDFVNSYNEKGQKVINLILTVITRGEDGELVVRKINNFSSDPKTSGCDAFFVADVMDHHLKPKALGGSGLFEDIDDIIQSGDHGPHFACAATVYKETAFFEKYGKKFHNKFLCSYHAYNRCDGAGVNVKRLAEAAARDGRGPLSAEDYSRMMNASAFTRTYSFTFASINRGTGIFPKLKEMKGVKTFCEMVFTHAGEKKDEEGEVGWLHTAGVVRARHVPGVGPWQVFDLLHRPASWGKQCQKCSVHELRPVYHTREKSRCQVLARAQAALAEEKKLRAELVQPDPGRIQGEQVPRNKRKHQRALPS